MSVQKENVYCSTYLYRENISLDNENCTLCVNEISIRERVQVRRICKNWNAIFENKFKVKQIL